MRITKMSLFILAALFSVSAAIANPSSEGEKSVFRTQIKNYVNNLDFESIEGKKKVAYVEFMINEKNEMIVLSTSSRNLDSAIKSALNYKSFNIGDLEYNKPYTIALRYIKK